MSPKKKCWSKSVGERGHKVRVYEPKRGSPLSISVFNKATGKEDRSSLGHRDKVLAVGKAYELVAERLATGNAIARREITLGMLVSMYLDSPSHEAKKPATKRQDARNLERLIGFLGPTRPVVSLSESDVKRYEATRRRGEDSLVGIRPGVPVGDRTIQADFVSLRTALIWGKKHRTATGTRLLSENPLGGIPFPREKNPRRPIMTHSTFEALLKVSKGIHTLLEVALVVANGTAGRVSAICSLRWSDVDLEKGTIRWRAEADKVGKERVVPVAPQVLEVLRTHHLSRPSIGDTPVFPSLKDPLKPCRRFQLDAWLRKAYESAGLRPEKGGLWHPIRRKWVTERKGHPTKDLALAGGWGDENTMVTCYEGTDPETIRQVVETRTHVYEEAEG